MKKLFPESERAPEMRQNIENPYQMDWTIHPDWAWSHLNYSLNLKHPKSEIEAIIIDPSNLMADVDKSNNYYVSPKK